MTPTQRLFITRLARDGFHARRKTGGGAHPSSSDLTENDGTFSDRSSAGAKQNLKGTEDILWTISTMGESVSGRATVTVHITATSSRSGVGRVSQKWKRLESELRHSTTVSQNCKCLHQRYARCTGSGKPPAASPPSAWAALAFTINSANASALHLERANLAIAPAPDSQRWAPKLIGLVCCTVNRVSNKSRGSENTNFYLRSRKHLRTWRRTHPPS